MEPRRHDRLHARYLRPAVQDPRRRRDAPDGKRFLYIDRDPTKGEGALYAGSTDGMEPVLVLDRASAVQFGAGHLLFLRDGNLVARRFDADTLQFLGDPVAIAEDVDYWNARDVGNFSVAGSLLIYKSAAYRNVQLALRPRGSTSMEAFGDVGRFSGLRVSPAGRLASVNRFEAGGASDVWLVDFERQAFSRLTFDGSVANSHAFSPDGERIALAQIGAVGRRVTVRSATGAPMMETVLEGSEWTVLEDWSADGKYLILSQQRAETGLDLFYLELEGKRELVPLVKGPQAQLQGRLSPNGRWLAYTSSESGRGEVYVVDFPAVRRKIQVTSLGGSPAPLRAAAPRSRTTSKRPAMSSPAKNGAGGSVDVSAACLTTSATAGLSSQVPPLCAARSSRTSCWSRASSGQAASRYAARDAGSRSSAAWNNSHWRSHRRSFPGSSGTSASCVVARHHSADQGNTDESTPAQGTVGGWGGGPAVSCRPSQGRGYL
jgi:hypothetical protein